MADVTFKTRIECFDSNLWYFHIMVPDDVVEHFKKTNEKRLICTLNDTVSFHCALMPSGDGQFFINVNKENRKKLGVSNLDPVVAKLKPDNSKYGMEICEEFEELLHQDVEGSEIFHALTPGKQRNLIYIASKPKGSETRIRKSLVILDYLKDSGGKLDFKQLNEAFKNSNRYL